MSTIWVYFARANIDSKFSVVLRLMLCKSVCLESLVGVKTCFVISVNSFLN